MKANNKDKYIIIGTFALAIILLVVGGIMLLANNRKYTVTFMDEGVEYYKVKVKNNNLIQRPTTPTKEGKQFAGWALNGRVVNFNEYKVTKDITLNAIWGEGDYQEESNFIVSFVTGDLHYNIESQLVAANDTAKEPDLSSINSIQVIGWFYEDGTKYNFDTPVTSNVSLFIHYMEDGKEIVAYNSEGIPEEENGIPTGPGTPPDDVSAVVPVVTPTPDVTPMPEPVDIPTDDASQDSAEGETVYK